MAALMWIVKILRCAIETTIDGKDSKCKGVDYILSRRSSWNVCFSALK